MGKYTFWRKATNTFEKFKFWKFWEHPLYEISEYFFKFAFSHVHSAFHLLHSCLRWFTQWEFRRFEGYRMQAHSQGVRCTTPNLHKGLPLANKWSKMGFLLFCIRVKRVRFKKVHFLGPTCPHFGDPAPPQNRSWLRAW